MVLMDVRSNQAPSGILASGGMSSSAGDPGTVGSISNPDGSGGHLCEAQDPIVISSCPVASSGSGACSPEPPAALSSRSAASSKGVWDPVELLYMGSRGGIS